MRRAHPARDSRAGRPSHFAEAPTDSMTDRNGSLSNFFLKLSDLSLLLVSLGLTIVHRYSPAENPGFVVDYLSERIKVTNALLGLSLVISWHIAFAVQGLYVSHRLRPLSLEAKEI